ncbi:hypothetical protein BN1723_013179 [Verticillium longisporum]|uniref:Uncharacterized protein n=1 Tax=Verticillium longisporum TaxID=100787 RepID=A0A0G4LR38_VERLO|nr:hypothetical protein BN1723_013179 [Verticillium longisporum]
MSSRDKSLLDRLNALKGGSGSSPHANNSPISLNRSANALNVSIGIEPAKPPSREDALAARLRSLRNTPERDTPPAAVSSSQASPPTPRPKEASASSPPPPQEQEQEQEQPHDVDPLLQTDDQTLEELLQDEDPEADPRWTLDLQPETARVEALLHELSKDIHRQDDKSAGGKDDPEAEKRDADEDTDGEEMGRDVDALLAQALDEAELDAKLNPKSSGSRDGPTENLPHEMADGPQKGNAGRQTPEAAASPFSLPSFPSAIAAHKDADDGDDGEPSLSLPSVPSGPATSSRLTDDDSLTARMAALRLPSSDQDADADAAAAADIGLPSVPSDQPANRLRSRTGYTDDDAKNWCTAAASPFSLPSVPSAIIPHKDVDDGDDGEPFLSLPSVPSGPVASSRPTDDDSLTARMAALRLPSSDQDAEAAAADDIGLPSVPSDQPANRLRSRTGYTDDDAKNWCTVCLEDATLRCLGCDDDGYCTRCWREMHVGPAAAFDDRTHKAVLLGRDPRPKRVALGA